MGKLGGAGIGGIAGFLVGGPIGGLIGAGIGAGVDAATPDLEFPELDDIKVDDNEAAAAQRRAKGGTDVTRGGAAEALGRSSKPVSAKTKLSGTE